MEIKVFMIGRTQVDAAETRKWLDYIGAADFEMPDENEVTDPTLLVALAAKRCYKSFGDTTGKPIPGLNDNLTKVRSNYLDYIDNILASRHGSVLEHSVFNFAIEGVSRVFTAEMNRHRAGWAISEGSLRYIRFDPALGIPYWEPLSLQPAPGDSWDILNRKDTHRRLMSEEFSHQASTYSAIMDLWDLPEGSHSFHYKKSMTSLARRIIGMGVATGGVWSGNVRALRHVLALRTSSGAEEEIRYVFLKVLSLMKAAEPMLFGDFDVNGIPKYHKV